MPWPAAIFLGLLTGVFGSFYAGYVADLATPWLRISSHYAVTYFVFFMGVLGFLGATAVGITTCRLAGHAGSGGVARGFGSSLLLVLGLISGAGALAWLQRDVAPLVGGQPIDLAVEIRLPAATERPPSEAWRDTYVSLGSGSAQRISGGDVMREDVRLEDGQWILPVLIPLTISQAPRVLSIGRLLPEIHYADLPVPGKPAALDEAWSPWIATRVASGMSPAASEAIPQVRYRVVRRVPPPLPPPPPLSEAAHRRAAFAALPADAPTAEFLAFVSATWRDDVHDQALRIARARPDFATALAARVAAPDHEDARHAMYLIGELRPPPAELADAVRARAAEVVRIVESIDASAANSRDRLYAEAHNLVLGIFAAAFGLREARVDLGPELRAMGAVIRPREQQPPHVIADEAERVASSLAQDGPLQ